MNRVPKRVLWTLLALFAVAIAAFVTRSWPPPDSIRRSRESVLRQDLFTIRDLLQQYYIDNGLHPHSLDDLVRAGYAKAIPTDPITGRNDTWVVERLKGPETGIIEVHSGSHLTAIDGTSYGTW